MRGGLHLSGFIVSPGLEDPAPHVRPGYNLSMGFDLEAPNPSLNVSVGLGFEQRGAVISKPTSGPYRETVDLKYLAFPILLLWKHRSDERGWLSAGGGIKPSINVGVDVDSWASPTGFENAERFDLLLAAEASVLRALGRSGFFLTLGLSGSYGLLDFTDDDGYPGSGNTTAHGYAFGVFMGIAADLGVPDGRRKPR